MSSPKNTLSDLVFDTDGALATECVFDRLEKARDLAAKESNRYFVLSLIFVALYLVKATGLRIDLTLFSTHVLTIPYGLFFYLLASHICECISFLRQSDAVSCKKLLRETAQAAWNDQWQVAEKTFPNRFEWFSITSDAAQSASGKPVAYAMYILSAFATALLAIALYLSPIAAGLYFLSNADAQITTGNRELQYWLIVCSTSLAGLWLVSSIAVSHLSGYFNDAE